MQPTKYFLVMEDISIVFQDAWQIEDGGAVRQYYTPIFKKGDVCEFIAEGEKNGYFKAKRVDSDDIHEIPYAPAFIHFIGNNLDTVETLYQQPRSEDLLGGLDDYFIFEEEEDFQKDS